MEADGDVQLLAGGPERVVVRVVPGPAVVDVRTEEDGPHPELAHRAARLGHRTRHVVRRHRGRAEQASGIGGLDVVVEPVVVRPARGRREARVHRVEGGDIHGGSRVEDREVEPLLVHRAHLRLGVEVPLDLLGVALAERLLLGVGERRPVPTRHGRHDLALDHGADVPPALAEPSWRARLELGLDVALPQVDGLHDVHLGVDHLEPVLGHDVRPPSASRPAATIAERRAPPRGPRAARVYSSRLCSSRSWRRWTASG